MEIVRTDAVNPDQLRAYITSVWHTDFVVAHGERMRPVEHAGFVGLDRSRIVGHASYRNAGTACELTAIAADPSRHGVGSRLLAEVVSAARESGCRRIWLTTTNDNIDAIRFYQRRGFHLSAIRPGAVDEARRTLKPEIPEIGSHGIPMSDELDLELTL